MKLYRVMSEDGESYVEAEDFGAAIKKWRVAKLSEYGSVDEHGNPTGWDNESEPDSVMCVHDEAVIR